MDRFIRLIAGLLLGWIVTSEFPVPAMIEPRSVLLSVTVDDPDGTPIAGLPVCVDSVAGKTGALTGANGTVTLRLTVGPDETRVLVQFEAGCAGGVARLREIISTMAVKMVYWAEIPPSATTAALTISLGHAALVSGRFLDETGQPVKSVACVREAKAVCRVSDEGRFRLPVQTGEPSELYFICNDGRHRTIRLEAIAQDRDLGDVASPSVQRSATARITLEAVDQVNHRVEGKGGAVSLISADGNLIFGFLAKDNVVMANTGTGSMPSIPAATYYVTPGMFGNSLSWRVLDAVRSGANVDLPGVPRLVAVAGQEATLTVNVPQAEAAINAIALPPSKP